MKTRNNNLSKIGKKIRNNNKVTNFKAYWNGTVMADYTLPTYMADEFHNYLRQDFFACYTPDEFDEQVDLAIRHLDNREIMYYNKYKNSESYTLNVKDMTMDMLLINEIVKRGIRPNDDKYGMLIMTYSI
jgi:hypothetical protein